MKIKHFLTVEMKDGKRLSMTFQHDDSFSLPSALIKLRIDQFLNKSGQQDKEYTIVSHKQKMYYAKGS